MPATPGRYRRVKGSGVAVAMAVAAGDRIVRASGSWMARLQVGPAPSREIGSRK